MFLYQLGYNRLWAPVPKAAASFPPYVSPCPAAAEGASEARIALPFEMVFGNKDLMMMILKFV
jgi:hypothetical protein